MSDLKTFMCKQLIDYIDQGIAFYIEHGYDLETARRLAKFDQEYIKTLTPSEVEEYLALRKRMK